MSHTEPSLPPLPALGEIPERMLAAVIRRERYGPPIEAFRLESVATPRPGPGQVLVAIVAAGINFNGVWASLGNPVDTIALHRQRGEELDYHIAGSDGSGVVWAVGDGVRHVSPGDEVILSGAQWDESAEDIRLGIDPLASRSHRVWGYERNHGSFAQFSVVDEYQCHPKPPSLGWEEAGCFLVTAATAYRQLCGWSPHTVRPGDPVLVWGGAGGLGSMAIQVVARRGGEPVVVVSGADRADHCRRLGAVGVIDRREFHHWGRVPPEQDGAAYAAWRDGVRAFNHAIWDVLGRRVNPSLVLEHPGRDTLPTSLYVCDNGGMVVTCGATTGYDADIDLRYLWMRQKRLQGSHFASTQECRAVIRMVSTGAMTPCLSRTVDFRQIGEAHQLMHDNRHPPGQMAVRINPPPVGGRTRGSGGRA